MILGVNSPTQKTPGGSREPVQLGLCRPGTGKEERAPHPWRYASRAGWRLWEMMERGPVHLFCATIRNGDRVGGNYRHRLKGWWVFGGRHRVLTAFLPRKRLEPLEGEEAC